MRDKYDVIVIGGGHAGAEAALASARLGADTLLITINLDHIGQMSCNPAVGGIAKGQVVREIDALGGFMGKVTDASTIQFRMLNRGKGPAVWSPRAQCDKVNYQRALKLALETADNLSVHQAMVEAFVLDGSGKLAGVVTQLGGTFLSKSFVVASGTFLNGKLHYGMRHFPGGRAGDPPSTALSTALREQLGLRLGRLKTGTPQRVLGKSIDFSQMTPQEAEPPGLGFSHFANPIVPATVRREMPCYLVKTTKETAAIVRDNLHEAPLYQGKIEGIGTRYCPSFEDKVVRFAHHETHTLYLEPEGEFTTEYYMNGISTSLPPRVQELMLKSVPGLEHAQISRYAYAIEYDFVFPDQITRGLAVKRWPNLFLAGQINGTSGYEEAGGQGLLAGMNAARAAANLDGVELGRDSSYIGVMVDDLVTKDIVEPYRLFTSRAEYRLRLRQDNADLRLCPLAFELGLLPEAQWRQFQAFAAKLDAAMTAAVSVKHEGKTPAELLIPFHGLLDGRPLTFPAGLLGLDETADRRVLEQLAIHFHYAAYIEREEREIEQLKKLERHHIPADFDFANVIGLRQECRDKLKKTRPSTLAQASRIDGVTPAELTLLRVALKRNLEHEG